MTDKEKYIQFVDVLCKMLGFNKPRDTLKMCEVISDFVESYEVRIKKLEQKNEQLKQVNEKLEIMIGKMKNCDNCVNLFECMKERKTSNKMIMFPCCWRLRE